MNTHPLAIGLEPAAPSVKDTLLHIHEQLLLAQLAAIKRLRSDPSTPSDNTPTMTPRVKGRSQVDLAEDILKSAATPLHVSDIIAHIAKRFNRQIDSESLVSALSKRVARKDRFRRTARNTFALI